MRPERIPAISSSAAARSVVDGAARSVPRRTAESASARHARAAASVGKVLRSLR